MNEHPDYLTIGAIVNGLDDLDLGSERDGWEQYIQSITGFNIIDLCGSAQEEIVSIRMASPGISGPELSQTAWVVGFFFGVRIARRVTSDKLDRNDPMMGIDPLSVTEMGMRRSRAFLGMAEPGDRETAMSCWLDAVCTGVHFDLARLQEAS